MQGEVPRTFFRAVESQPRLCRIEQFPLLHQAMTSNLQLRYDACKSEIGLTEWLSKPHCMTHAGFPGLPATGRSLSGAAISQDCWS